jgi:hypothetical protein
MALRTASDAGEPVISDAFKEIARGVAATIGL